MTEQENSKATRKNEFVDKDGRILRYGFTTGSCAAAAAAAATQMLLTGEIVSEVEISTPGGPVYRAQIFEPEISFGEKIPEEIEIPKGVSVPVSSRCAVRKDGGDDPDITTGMLIVAEVSVIEAPETAGGPQIVIEGGKGIGRVTKPGLDQPVGEAAINRVPREMIGENVKKVLEAWQAGGKAKAGESRAESARTPYGIRVVISAPEGETLAKHTFNPRIGITGGISILGTTGIVEPMSDRAVVETIRTQMNVLRAQGRRFAVLAPGNYGLGFLAEKYGMEENEVVMISNFAAEAAKLAAQAGFEGILLAGHIGKLVKIAGGARNTHSMYGDRRMEVLWEIAGKYIREQERDELQRELADCVMTDAALHVLEEFGVKEQTALEMVWRICTNMREWSGGRLRAETIVFSNSNCELARSEGAKEMLREYTEKRI